MAKHSALTRFSQASIKKASSRVISRSAETSRFELVIRVGDKSKVISTRIESAKINEAWGRVIKNEKV